MEKHRHVRKLFFDLRGAFETDDPVGAYLDWVSGAGWKIVSVFQTRCRGLLEWAEYEVWHFVLAGSDNMEDPISPWRKKEA